MLKVLLFLKYYSQKRLTVLLGHYRTSNPLGLRWRWNHWQYIYDKQKKKRKPVYFRFKRLFQKQREG